MIYALGDLEPRIHPEAYVHPDAVIIGDVDLGAEATVWPCAVLRGDVGGLVVGPRTSIQDGTVVHTTKIVPTSIGADCVIGHNAHLEGCTVHDGALIGSGSIVLHGAVVESGALVAAGAVVAPRMVVPSKAMARGVPAKITPDRVDPERMIAQGARYYVERGRRYRAELRRLD